MSKTIDTITPDPEPITPETDTLLTEKELAKRWSSHPGTLANNRVEGKGIPYVRLVSGTIRYRLSDIVASEVRVIPQQRKA